MISVIQRDLMSCIFNLEQIKKDRLISDYLYVTTPIMIRKIELQIEFKDYCVYGAWKASQYYNKQGSRLLMTLMLKLQII